MTNEPSWAALALTVALLLVLLGVVAALVLTEDTAVRGLGVDTLAPRVRRPRDSPTDGEQATDGGPASAGETPTRAPRSAFGGGEPHTQHRVAIIVNPTKFDDVNRARVSMLGVCREQGWADPLWLETTSEDPGTGQTEQALAAGVDLVCALGGDGTVRTVGAALAGTGMPMGLLAAGTGNLLARNLKLPIDSATKALTIALTGRNKPIDTCTLRLTRPTEQQLQRRVDNPQDFSDNVDIQDAVGHQDAHTGVVTKQTEDHVFLVMAGVGFDAEVMAGAPEALKAKVGWAAYAVAGARHLKGPQFIADIRFEDGTRIHRRARGLIIGNVGRLQGGVVLMPDAVSDDGVADLMLISPQGIVGWGAVMAQVLTRQRKGHERVEHVSTKEVTVEVSKPIEIQLDGDTLGTVVGLKVTVDPGSLIVRMPA